MYSLIALFALWPVAQQDPVADHAKTMLNLATSEQPIVNSAVVDAPVSDVWKAFTTTEGIKSWMVAEGDIDLRIGGKMRTAYAAGTDLGGPNAIENTIIAYDPERMLTIQNTKAPEIFPFKKAISQVWTVIYFEPVGKEKTKVTVRMLGYRAEDEFVQMRRFFMDGNQQTIDELVKHFGHKDGKGR
jgi:uncharacterized protein YndB with AHSA1/START domain